jgi:hypothetical protein
VIIAQLPGIEIQPVSPAKAQAAAEWSHGRWLILLNAAETRGRQRFSLVHPAIRLSLPILAHCS